MVQLLVKLAENDVESKEWTVLELQGELETKSETASLNSKAIGDLHFTPKGVPVLIIGHHILYGKVNQLEKPMVVLTKEEGNHVAMETDQNDSVTNDETQYLVKAVIKRKIVFKTRPKPIITNVPKKL